MTLTVRKPPRLRLINQNIDKSWAIKSQHIKISLIFREVLNSQPLSVISQKVYHGQATATNWLPMDPTQLLIKMGTAEDFWLSKLWIIKSSPQTKGTILTAAEPSISHRWPRRHCQKICCPTTIKNLQGKRDSIFRKRRAISQAKNIPRDTERNPTRSRLTM